MANILAESGKTVEVVGIHTSTSMMPDNNKNGLLEELEVQQLSLEEVREQKARGHLTDINRVNLTAGFLASDADWIFWIDDDTVPPNGAIGKLLKLKRPFTSGIYFLANDSHNPIAYFRKDYNKYSPIYNYPKGTLLEVDAVGMGCALIHRSVYEKIKAAHNVMMRPDGSLIVLPKSMFKNGKAHNMKGAGYVQDGIYHMPLTPMPSDDNRPFPYYQLEYSRTEDMLFCELCANVGIRPVVDTTIVCGHVKTKTITEQDYIDKLPETIDKAQREEANLMELSNARS